MGGRRNKLKKPQVPLTVTNPDDQDLMDDLIAQLDSRDEQVQAALVLNEINLNTQADQVQAPQKPRAKDRFQARQTRKSAALGLIQTPDDPQAEARLRREAEQEEMEIKLICDELNVRIHDINADGHCLYSAIADQLALLSILPPNQANYNTTRLAASNYMWTHPDEFLPFLLEDQPGASDSGFMSPQSFERYCAAIRDTSVWGGEPEILALSRAYNVPIHVVQGGAPPVVVHNPTGAPKEGDVMESKVVRISYHRRLYGLGEHYNSLRPKGNLIRNAFQALSS